MTVSKHRRESEGNPPLCVTSFDGPTQIERRFKDVLTRSDWFRLVSTQSKAEYRLAARYSGSEHFAIDMLLTTRSGKRWRLRQSGSSSDRDLAIFRAVDQLIQTAHANPGLCASRIAFAVGGKAQKEVFICSFDGTGAKQLTHNRSISTEPSWGPSVDTLVYTAYERTATSVVLIDMAQNRQRRLSHFRGLNSGADLSSDGRYAALTLSRDGRIELYLMDTKERGLKRLTNDSATESSPCWSPNSSQICYVSDRRGRPQLYLVPGGGGPSRRLLRDAAETVSPDWSAVSNRIVCSTKTAGGYALAVVDMGKSPRVKEIIVPERTGNWESPSWAPDGRHVVGSFERSDGRRELCMVDTWHGRVIPITEPANHSLPNWSPLF